MAASLVGLKGSGGGLPCQAPSNVQVCIAVTPWPDFKCLGVHCCYSAARLFGLPADIQFISAGVN